MSSTARNCLVSSSQFDRPSTAANASIRLQRFAFPERPGSKWIVAVAIWLLIAESEVA